MKHIILNIAKGLRLVLRNVLIGASFILLFSFPIIIGKCTGDWYWMYLYGLHFTGILYLIGLGSDL